MGAGTSKEQQQWEEQQREEESLAASTGSLPMLKNAFRKLAAPEAPAVHLSSLEEIFSLSFPNLQSESISIPQCFPGLLANLGPSIVELFFRREELTVTWLNFLRGYNGSCGRMPASTSIHILYKLYFTASRKAENPVNLEFDSDENDSKISGSLSLNDVLMFLWMCWIVEHASRVPMSSRQKATLILPDLHHLITSAFISCNEVANDLSFRDPSIFNLEKSISAHKLHLWILTTVPNLARCVPQYVQHRLKSSIGLEDGLEPSVSSEGDDTPMDASNCYILTRGRAWAISLSLRNATDELLHACFTRKGTGTPNNVVYRSSIHGKGLSRFWSNVEGYHGPLLVLVSTNSININDGDNEEKQCIIAILTGQGFENRDIFYGSSGYLFALSPIFRVFPASGKDKNFMYCHTHLAKRVYDPNPKPMGIAFGGTLGNERIFIDEDFAKVTIRHHAVDKTYQPGFLIPNQGFLASEATILDVEIWGLGGKVAKEQQGAYKKRENLFSEQRRKVDLKNFANWEDSPEKMMMDMVSDPNKVQREDR